MAERTEHIKAGGISIHAVDVSRGVPAGGLSVRLALLGQDPRVIAEGVCAETGHFLHPVAEGADVVRGLYEVEFGVGTYFRHAGVAIPDPSFLDLAVFRFGIDAVTEHFHLPFKFTPWGFSLFRGGA
ncbi:MAG: hydroxyisourate hydrolase [Pseudomonadota bacterium]